MRWFGLLFCLNLILNACVMYPVEEPRLNDPRPVDMVYQVTVEQLENDCEYGGEVPEGLVLYVDIRPRSDGSFDLKHSSTYIPLPDLVQRIARDQGNVDHLDSWTSSLSGDTYWLHVTGHLTPDELNLTVDSEDEKWGVGVHQLCRRKVVLTGQPMPLKDPQALLGTYLVSFDEYGPYCFYQERPEPAKHLFNARLDVLQHYTTHQNASYRINGNLVMGLPLPNGQGKIESGLDHNGKPDLSSWAYAEADSGWMYEFQSSAIGTAKPPEIDLDIWLGQVDENLGPCADSYRMHGRKHIPSPASVDGWWMAEATGWNGCKDQPIDDAWPLFLVSQKNGQVDMWEKQAALDLNRDGQRVHRDAYDEIEGYDIRLEGSLAPPHFSYFLNVGLKQGYGEEAQWCYVTMQVRAKPRFLD